MISNEMFPNQTSYVEEGRTGPQHCPLFRIGVHVSGLIFHGVSHTKQKARHEAAKVAINYLRGCQQMTERSLNSSLNDSFNVSNQWHNRNHYHNYDNYHRYQPYYRYSHHRWGRFHTSPDYYSPNQVFNYDKQLDSNSGHPMSYTQQDNTFLVKSGVTVGSSDGNSDSNSDGKSGLNFADNDNRQQTDPLIVSKSESKQKDFTSDDYNDDSFVEFDKNVDKEELNGELNGEESDFLVTSEKVISEPKRAQRERIILRVMSETPVNQNPVSVIHELQPNAKWVCTELTTRKHSTRFQMRLLLPLANKCFIGTANTKKLAKAEAASKALLELYNICINPSTGSSGSDRQSSKSRTTVQIADKPLFLKQEMANRVGAAVMDKCTQVWDQLTDLKKWTVLSAIVLTDETNVDFVEVICLTSGTKCVKGDSLSMNGYALNDCHAEVLARRAFISFIYRQIEKLVDNNFEGIFQFECNFF